MQVKPTAAVYRVKDPVEVMSFLTSLVEWGRSQENAWHHAKGCSGWRLNPDPPSLAHPLPEHQGGESASEGIGNGKKELPLRQSFIDIPSYRPQEELPTAMHPDTCLGQII